MNLYSGTTRLHKRILVALVAILMLAATMSTGDAAPSTTLPPEVATGGQDDFDWEIGAWRTKARVLAEPLSDTEDEWLQFRGASLVRPLAHRQANVVDLDVSGPAGRLQALNLRLYEPQAGRWSSTFVSIGDGLLTPSVYGGFHDGVGEFYGQDQLGGRPIEVRFLIFRQGPDRARFEQAFSDDGGATWETNWIAIDRRISS